MAQTATTLTSTTPTVASSGGPGVIILNPVAKTTSLTLTSTTAAGSSDALVQIEYSLDIPDQRGAATTTWMLLSSATAMESSTIVAAGGLSYTVLTPIAQVRVISTSGSTTTPYLWTLDALQSVTA